MNLSTRPSQRWQAVGADGQITLMDYAEQLVKSGPWRAHHESGGGNHRSTGDDRGNTLVGGGWTTETNTTAGIWGTWSGNHLVDATRRTRKLAEQRAVESCDTAAIGLVERRRSPGCKHTNRDNETCERPIGRDRSTRGTARIHPPESNSIAPCAEPCMFSCGES